MSGSRGHKAARMAASKPTGFSRWLRSNSEHYLMLDAQTRVAARYGRRPPPPPKGISEIFWRRIFAPTYRRLPWKLRSAVIQRMPGSHRRDWSSRAPATRPRPS